MTVSASDPEELVIFLHGYATNAKGCDGLIKLFEQSGRPVFAPEFEAEPFTKTAPDDVVASIAQAADRFVKFYPSSNILLCAHSMGCVFLKAAIVEWARNANSSIGSVIRGDTGEPRSVRTLLLASTNRGFRPQGVPAIGLEIAHRWFWLLLMFIAWCWLLRCFISEWLSLGLALVTALGLGAATILALRHRARPLLGWSFVVLASLWIAWVIWDGAQLLWVAAGMTPVTTLLTCRMFNYRWSSTVWLTLLSLAFVSLPFLWEPTFFWVWPSILGLAWPAMVWPWTTGLLVENVLFGSPWLTRIRMDWLDTFANVRQPAPMIPTVHLFGDRDRLVDDGDHEELTPDKNSFEFALKDGNHKDFILTARPGRESTDSRRHSPIRWAIARYLDGSLAGANPNERATAAGERTVAVATDATPQAVGVEPVQQSEPAVVADTTRAEVQTAMEASGWRQATGSGKLTESTAHTLATDSQRQSGNGTQPSTADETTVGTAVKPDGHVIFLIHGIRDFGEWQDALAAKIRAVAEQLGQEVLDVVIIRYGYFNAFQFLLWAERDRASRLFLDAYAQARSRFPNAKFHVAAHSNGTYVVANALLRESEMRLDNVYFAGSVVWRGYFGDRRPGLGHAQAQGLRAGQVQRLRSDCASRDWPVGSLCWWLSLGNRLRWGMVGTGGVDGFDPLGDHVVSGVHWLRGGHGEGLRAKRHEDIARYLITGQSTLPASESKLDHLYLWLTRLVALAAVLAVVGLYAFTIAVGHDSTAWGVFVGSLLTIVVVRIAMAV